MEEIKKTKFMAKDKNGKEFECEVWFTFESDDTKKNYIVYTDNETDESGNIKVYASIYDPLQEPTELLPIEDEKEWKMVEDLLNKFKEENE
jgi:uncharacterized protein YrzB (UPF0473 family)